MFLEETSLAIFTMRIARYKATRITADLRSLFPFPLVLPYVLRTFPSHSRVHVSDFIHARAIRLHAPRAGSALTIGMKCNRYHASLVRRQVDVCMYICMCVCVHSIRKLMRSTDLSACVRFSRSFNFSECPPIEKQFKDFFDEFRGRSFPRRENFPEKCLTEIEILQDIFRIKYKDICELLALKKEYING